MDGVMGFILVVIIFIVCLTIYNVIDSNNNRRRLEAATRVDIAQIEYNRMMGIIVDKPQPTEVEKPEAYDILSCPKCKGECTIPNYNNTEEEDCDRCDGSGEFRWDHFTEDEKKKYLDK